MTVLAALCVAMAVALSWPIGHQRRWARLQAPGEARLARPRILQLWPVTLVPVGLLLGLPFAAAGPILGMSVGAIVGTSSWLLRTQRRRRRAARAEAEVVASCRLLVGLLRVGQVPGSALGLAAKESSVLAQAAAAQRAGGSVPDALRADAARPGQEGLAEVAVAWELSERTGASMTAALDSVVERQTARAAVAEIVAAELAAPRATGRLLAVLPLAGIVLGFALGGDPLEFLLGATVGRASLAVGIGLACTGVLWTDWLARPEAR